MQPRHLACDPTHAEEGGHTAALLSAALSPSAAPSHAPQLIPCSGFHSTPNHGVKGGTWRLSFSSSSFSTPLPLLSHTHAQKCIHACTCAHMHSLSLFATRVRKTFVSPFKVELNQLFPLLLPLFDAEVTHCPTQFQPWTVCRLAG